MPQIMHSSDILAEMTAIELLHLFGKYVWPFVPTVVGGAYYGSYLKKRGEDDATHRNLDRLVEQMSTVTQATKAIEAKISIALWSRQQRWEVQKSALLDSLKELASSEALLWALVWVFSGKDSKADEGKQHRKEANEKYFAAINDFWRTKLAMEIVCGKKIGEQFQKIDRLLAIVAKKARQGDFGEIWATQFEEIQAAKNELGDLIRKELEFDPIFTPLSSASSANRGPAPLLNGID
jgi:hypothetical protein